jgi:hypothetical protein
MVALLKENYGREPSGTKSCYEDEPADSGPPFAA